MFEASLTPVEKQSLIMALSATDSDTAGARGALKGVLAAGALQTRLDLKIWQYFDALSEGLPGVGDKMLCTVLCTLTKYLTSWGVIVLMVFSLVQFASTASGWAQKAWAWLKKISGLLAPLEAVKAASGAIFHHDAADENPAQAMGVITTLIAAQVPVVGALIATIGSSASDAGSPLPLDPGNNYRRGVETDVAYDVAYDADVAYDVAEATVAAAMRLGVDPRALQGEIEKILRNDEELDADEAEDVEEVMDGAFADA